MLPYLPSLIKSEDDPVSLPKSRSTLPTEILIRIITYLRNPIPPPLSKPPRSALRQHALTVTARVNKLFNKISTEIIYRVVMTDNLVHFFADARSTSRRKLLAYTKALYIEYPQESDEISYDSVMRYGHINFLWMRIAPLSSYDKRWSTKTERHAELLTLETCLKELGGRDMEGALIILPRLTTVAVSSLLDRSNRWRILLDRGVDYGLPLGLPCDPADYQGQACALTWSRILTCSNVTHFCVRDGSHPLSIPNMIIDNSKSGSKQLHSTVHYEEESSGFGLRFGPNLSWASDIPLDTPWQRPYRTMSTYLEHHTSWRATRGSAANALFVPLELDIYNSTSQVDPWFLRSDFPNCPILQDITAEVVGESTRSRVPLTEGQQRAIAKKLGGHFQSEMRKITGQKDIIRWHCSSDFPVCKACGSHPQA